MSMHRTVVVSILVAIVTAAVVLLIPRRTHEPVPRRLPAPSYLSPEEQRALRMHMDHHGANLLELEWDVVLLDYDATRARAERLANEPAIGAGSDESGLRTALPDRFYRLQEAMQLAARHLAHAAAARDTDELARAYGELASTCVDCHRVYSTGKR